MIAPKSESPNLLSVLNFRERSDEGCSKPPSIVLNGHIDQFPVEDASKWKHDPYSGDVEDGYILGRSGVDMKAGTAASIIAFTYLHQICDQLKGKCVLQVVSDEETGGRWGTRYLLEHMADRDKDKYQGDCILIGEPITAQAAHGAYTHRSEGAIRIACRLITALLSLEKLDLPMDEKIKKHMQQPAFRRVADSIMWPGAVDAMLHAIVNIGTITGGLKINMIPSSCTFSTDIRIPIGVPTSHILSSIDTILHHDFPTSATYTVHENHSHASTHNSPTHPVVGLLQDNASLIHHASEEDVRSSPEAICSLGATDCKHFRRHDIPAYAYGPSPRGMAEVDEKVSAEEFLETGKVHVLTGWDYLGGG
ncbi:putative peptidase M20, bacterial exopeptidase dimerization domain-containing protein [Septoria linicola]|nr:putative peptidase M20, bacterial exopeptidase dimerization domain-containing protein [Septoria linicola]